MKTLKYICLILIASFALKASAQTDKATTAKIVDEKNYRFVATNAIPMNSVEVSNILRQMPGGAGSSTINLSGDNYDLRITADSVIAYLPYYGRSFTAPIDRNDSGFKFTSKDFTYSMKKLKRGWDISIVTKDVKDAIRMNLSITESGYATLNVMSNSRQAITFNGYLSEVVVGKSK